MNVYVINLKLNFNFHAHADKNKKEIRASLKGREKLCRRCRITKNTSDIMENFASDILLKRTSKAA